MRSIEHSKRLSEYNARLFDELRRSPRHSIRDRNAPSRGIKPPDVMADFEMLGINSEGLKKAEAQSLKRQEAYLQSMRDYQAKSVHFDGAKYQDAKGKFLAARPGAQHFFPEVTSVFTSSGAPPPPPPPHLSSNSDVQQPQGIAKGSGLGWSDDDSKQSETVVAFDFSVFPSVAADYTFTGLMWLAGSYLVSANDQWWNSKQAHLDISVGITVNPWQTDTPPPVQVAPPNATIYVPNEKTIFDLNNDNIDQSGAINDGEVLVYSTASNGGPLSPLPFGYIVTCWVFCSVYAQGAGAVAEFDFSGPNRGIGCPIVSMVRNS